MPVYIMICSKYRNMQNIHTNPMENDKGLYVPKLEYKFEIMLQNLDTMF